MNRRTFLRKAGSALAVAPFIAATKLADIGKAKREPLKRLNNGQVLTSDYMNDMVQRINDIEQNQ